MATRDETIRLVLEVLGEDAANKMADALEGVGDSAKKADPKLAALVDEFEKLGNVDRQIASFVKFKAALADTDTRLEQARKGLADLNTQFSASDRSSRAVSAAFAKAEREIAKLTEQQRKQTLELQRSSGALAKAGVDTTKLGEAQRTTRTSMQALVEQAAKLRERLTGVSSSSNSAADGVKRIKTEAAGAGGAFSGLEASLGKIVSLAGAVALAVNGIQFAGGQFAGAVELEQQLAEVQAVAGGAADQLAKLRDAAQDAAARTGIATEQITGGLAELARAGLTAEQAIAALGPTLDLAQAGGIGLSEAVTITTTTLTQFGLAAEDTQRVADVLAQAANSSQSSVQGLGLSLSYAAPLARQLGLNLESTTAIIAALADEGFRGERAGTALRNVFSALSDPASNFRAELVKLNIHSSDLGVILGELAKRGEAGKAALLALDSEARPAILSLFNKGGESIAKFVAELEKAQGAASKTAEIIRDTLGNSWERLGEIVDNTFSDLIEPLLKPLQGQLESLAQQIKDFAASEDFKRLQDSLVTTFTEGLEAFREYAAGVDLSQLSTDFSNFTASIGDTVRLVREFREELKLLGYVKDFADSVNVAKIAADGLADGIESLADDYRAGEAAAAAAAAKIRDTGTAAQDAAADVSHLGPAITDWTQPVIPALREVQAGIEGLLPAAQQGSQGFSLLRQEAQTTQDVLKRSGEALQSETDRLLENSLTAQQALLELQRQQLEFEKGLAEARATGASIAELRRYSEAIEETKQRIIEVRELLGAPVPQNKALADNVQQIATAANEAKAAVEQTDAAAQSAGSAAGGYINALQAFITEFMGVSDAALAQFIKFQRGTVGVGTPLEKSALKLIEAAEATREAIGAQKDQATVLGQIFDEVANAGENAGEVLSRIGLRGAGALEDFGRAVRAGTTDINLLNQADLDKLAAAADRAAAKVRQIQEEAAEAARELQDMAQTLQDSIDQRGGNLVEIERRRYAEELKRIDELSKKSGAAAAAQAAETRRLAEIEHQQRMAEIAEEAEAERKATDDNAAHIDRVRKKAGGGSGGGNASAGLGVTNRFELVIKNEQVPGGIFAEMTESDIAMLGQEIIRYLGDEGART